MKHMMIALTVLALMSSLTATADDQSHAFNDAVSNLHSLQDQEKDNLAHYNDTQSRDGTGRFNADGTFNDALANKGDQITADRRAAQREVNGTTYRNQVRQQQQNVIAFATAKGNGNGGGNGGHASHGGTEGRGSDNAHSSAFGGHGYGHDNSRSEGFGGHSQFR